ncbi:MAG: DUF454 domain-containing protein [Chloroflexi bacterium]|jgi:uncharacterized membrane protein YbaN (DUF454 family)|nr:DUF454 domain-containing protein [Chloroflexota bacterium]
MQRWVLVALGSVFVGIGVLGIFIPILPTTPLLLLGAACYAKSSQTFYDRLLHNRYLGEYIRNYREGKGLPLRAKIMALTLLWATIGYAVIAVIDLLPIRALLILIAAAVTIHLCRLPTPRR